METMEQARTRLQHFMELGSELEAIVRKHIGHGILQNLDYLIALAILYVDIIRDTEEQHPDVSADIREGALDLIANAINNPSFLPVSSTPDV